MGLTAAGAGLAGLAGSCCLRLGVAGSDGVRSSGAAAVFAVALLGVSAAVRLLSATVPSAAVAPPPVAPATVPPAAVARTTVASLARLSRPGWWLCGLLGAAALCAVPLLVHLRGAGQPLPAADFPAWALGVTAVAVAEERLLRGALWEALALARGEGSALTVTTLAFAALHVPFYGWQAVPLDLAVGLLLGGLRQASGSWRAAGVAHALADLAGWWLR